MSEEPEKEKRMSAEDRNTEGKPLEATGMGPGSRENPGQKSQQESEQKPGEKAEPESEPKPGEKAEPESEPKPGEKAEPESEPKPDEKPEPETELRDEQGHRYLSPEAINAWRISGALGSVVYWLVPLGYGALSMGGEMWPEWPSYVLGAFFLTYTILEGTVIPWIRWKRWRYHVDHNEIDLRRGLFVVTRTLIPIKRVQHVDTRQGPVYRQFGLASVTVTTAGDTHEIPALSEPVADELRKTISEYARIAREDL